MAAMRTIPFLDVRSTYVELKREIDAAVARVLDSGWYVLGGEVSAFEQDFARFCQARSCVGVGTGLDALVLALRATGVGPGDEVVVPANTFIATWLAVSQCGARIVPVDPKPGSCLLDPDSIADAISPRTRAIIPVHLYGYVCDVRGIRSLLGGRDVALIEDAAQAHGALRDGEPPGCWGDVAAWSFYPGKNLGAFGDAGALTTNDSAIAERLRLLRNYGSTQKYVHEVAGTNSRLDPIQACILQLKLSVLADWNARRHKIAKLYEERLSGVHGVSCFEWPRSSSPSWHLFVIRHHKRDELRARLRERGIETVVHYPTPPHLQQAYAGMFALGSFPEAERQSSEVLSLPIGPHLSLDDASYVADAVCECA